MFKWYEIAKKELGVCEIPGIRYNDRIIEYHSTTSLKATSDEVSWCSSFVNWCIVQSGLKGTNSAAARSWLKWGVKIDEPVAGCIVVLKRGTNPQQGHVSFFVEDLGDKIRCLGGNQSDKVKLSVYSKRDLLSYRLPVGSNFEQEKEIV